MGAEDGPCPGVSAPDTDTYKFKPGVEDLLTCSREPDNAVGHKRAILITRLVRVVGRMPWRLADFVSPNVDEGDVEQVDYIFTGISRRDGQLGPVLECSFKFGCDENLATYVWLSDDYCEVPAYPFKAV